MRWALFVAAFLATAAQAWWCTGHMIIVEIARQNLKAGVEAQVDAVINTLSTQGPFPLIPTMVPAACWADDLKEDGLGAMEQWHFINQPYNPTNFRGTLKPEVIQDDNVAKDIKRLGVTAKISTINDWERSFAITNLLHFYGDVHQPLHATDMFSAEFPRGDYGGNLFPVWLNGVNWRLHFIWDSVCNVYPNQPVRPPTKESAAQITAIAQQFQANYTFTPEQKACYNSTIMAEESYQYAIQYAYANLVPNANISQQYIDNCIVASGQRLTLAGYRLASELNYIFDESNKMSTEKIVHRMNNAKKEFKDYLSNKARASGKRLPYS